MTWFVFTDDNSWPYSSHCLLIGFDYLEPYSKHFWLHLTMFYPFWPQIQATLFKNSPLVLAFSSCLCRLRPVRLNESRQIQFDVLLPLIFVCFLLHTKWCSTKTAERKMTCEYIFHLPGRTRALLQLQFRPETINLQVMQNSRLL